MLQGAMQEVEITPPLGVSIPGYFENRLSTGVKDELHAKALALNDDSLTVIIIALDAIGIYHSDVCKIRKRVFDFTGVPEDCIMVSANHIHTGPPIANTFESRRDDDYSAYMIRKAADAAVEAFHHMVPCRIGAGKGTESGISFNRRYFMRDGSVRTNPGINNPDIIKPTGPIDPSVMVIRMEDMEHKPMGAVVNFACHPDVVSGTEFSADYPGELSRTLKKAYGSQFVSLFLLGACGNLNHVDVHNREKPEHYKKMGRILAGEVQKVWEKIRLQDETNVALKAVTKHFLSKTRIVTDAELRAAQQTLADASKSATERIYAQELLEYVKTVHPEERVELQGIRIGDAAILGLPAEIFVELGLKIKDEAPSAFTMLSTQTNGRFGYIPTGIAFSQGGYEPRTTRMNRLVPEAGEKMTAVSQEVLTELQQE